MDDGSQKPSTSIKEATRLLKSVSHHALKLIENPASMTINKDSKELAELISVMDELLQAGFTEDELKRIRLQARFFCQ